MIPRTTSRPHICLSCQRRLARQSTPSKLQAAFQSTDSWSEKDVPEKHQQVRRTLVPLSHFIHPSKPLAPFLRYRPVEEKLGDTYGFRGHSLLKQRESLKDSKNLGDPAEVLLLRESKIHRYDHGARLPDDVPANIDAKHIDILEQVQEERGLISQEEVVQNINEFRPEKDKEPQNWDDFNTLVQHLQKSFTVPQLEKYIHSFENKQPEDSSPHIVTWSPLSHDAIHEIVLDCSPWLPTIGEFESQDDKHSSRGYTLASHTSKQRVVIQLLRQCWKLSVPELDGGIGSMEVRMRVTDLNLLLKHSVLDAMKEDYLPRYSQKLEGFPSKGVIRITASRKKCDIIITQLRRVLKNVQTSKLSLLDLMPPPDEKPEIRQLNRWADKRFDDAALQELGRLTNTEITRVLENKVAGDNRPKKELLISCLTSPQDVWLSNRASVARRLLVTSGNFSTRQQLRLGCKMSDSTTFKSGIFSDYATVEGLPWRDRLRKWTRWTIPIAKPGPVWQTTPMVNDPDENGEAEELYQEELPRKVNSVTPNPTKAKPSATKEELQGVTYWNDKYETVSSGILGSVIHSHLNRNPKAMPKTPFEQTDQAVRIFSTALPNLSGVLKECQLSPSHVPDEVLILHFQPNPFHKHRSSHKSIGAGALSAFPPLEMHFHVDKSKALKLKSIQAVVREEGTDLMLPNQAVDVRFYQKTTSHLRTRWLESKHIKDFLAASNLTYEGRRLDLPVTLPMRIAKHLCQNASLIKLGKNPEADIHDVEYLFVGREARRSMMLQYQGWKLEYTNIDAGRTGGRRSELQLRPISMQQRRTQEEYVQSVYNLAESFGTGMSAGPKVRKLVAKDNLTRMLVMSREKSKAKPVKRIFSHRARRPLDGMEKLLEDDWWGRVQDGSEKDVKEGESVATKDEGALAQDKSSVEV